MTKKEEKADKMIKFRGKKIPQFEADVLQEIEKLTWDGFTKVNTVEWYTSMGFFSHSN